MVVALLVAAAVGLIVLVIWRAARSAGVTTRARPIETAGPASVQTAHPSASDSPLPPSKGLHLTGRAATKVKDLSRADKVPARLRVRVVGKDAHFEYDAFFEDEVSPFDETFTSKGVDVVVDPLSFQYLDGTTIDYAESDGGFTFDNPNVRP